jgi:hypothetical protein
MARPESDPAARRRAQDKGEAIMRAYTPTSSDEDLGYFDLVVKVYFANEHPSFPLVRPPRRARGPQWGRV